MSVASRGVLPPLKSQTKSESFLSQSPQRRREEQKCRLGMAQHGVFVSQDVGNAHTTEFLTNPGNLWIPACAGMTVTGLIKSFARISSVLEFELKVSSASSAPRESEANGREMVFRN